MTGGIVMVRLTRCQFMISVNQPLSQKRSLIALQLINQYESIYYTELTTLPWHQVLAHKYRDFFFRFGVYIPKFLRDLGNR